jgi:hypothetical protein
VAVTEKNEAMHHAFSVSRMIHMRPYVKLLNDEVRKSVGPMTSFRALAQPRYEWSILSCLTRYCMGLRLGQVKNAKYIELGW